jgi:heme exporter protein C
MLWPLFVMLVAMTLFFVAAQFAAMRNEILRRRLRTLELGAAAAAARPATVVAGSGGAVAQPRTVQ